MAYLRYVFLVSALLWVSACSNAIPNVTTLMPASPDTPSNVGDTSFGINSGGGEMTGPSYKVFSKIGPHNRVMKGNNYRIHTSGDN